MRLLTFLNELKRDTPNPLPKILRGDDPQYEKVFGGVEAAVDKFLATNPRGMPAGPSEKFKWATAQLSQQSELPIEDMIGTETHLYGDALTRQASDSFSSEMPLVAKAGDAYVIIDGNHRIAQAYTNGNPTAKVALLDLPELEVGDELMVGKFKNSKATIKGFKKDKHNQPVAKTNKGDQQVFKGRVKKLMNHEMSEAGAVSSIAAAKYIAADEELFDAISGYVFQQDHFRDEGAAQLPRFLDVLRRVRPINKRLYRGEPAYEYNNWQPYDDHEMNMGFSSWTTNVDTAQMHNRYTHDSMLKYLNEPVRAIRLEDIVYWRNRLFPDEGHYGGSQGEYFVLEPVVRRPGFELQDQNDRDYMDQTQPQARSSYNPNWEDPEANGGTANP